MYYYQEASTWQIKVSQRASVSDPWPQGTAVSGLPGSSISFPSLSSDELTIVFDNPSVGGWDMYIATRPNINSSFGNIRSLNELNTAGFDSRPFLSPDALSIYWSNGRQIFEAIRSSLNDPFGNIQHLSALDMPDRYNDHPAISSDGTAIYFISGLSVSTNTDIYVSYLVPEPATLLLLGLGGLVLRKRRA
jgi:Tol biopolymer transport system component